MDSTLIDDTSDEEFMPRITCWGTFAHPWPFNLLKIWPMIKFLFSKSRYSIPNVEQLEKELPVFADEIPPVPGFLWLGHSSFLFNSLDENNEIFSILTDPVMSNRVPDPYGPARLRPIPFGAEKLPGSLRAVIISHNHYDHLDIPTLKSINTIYGSKLYWLCGKGTGRLIRSAGCHNVVELSWFEHYTLPNGVKLTFTPAQHWCARTPFDFNRSLWGSWIIEGNKHKYFFAGDTGYYKRLFQHIGNVFEPFDLAAIPIGAYEPRNALSQQHVNPDEAVKIHQLIHSRKSIAIHWGTFPLGKEGFFQPRDDLKLALQKYNVPEDDFTTVAHGKFYPLKDNNK